MAKKGAYLEVVLAGLEDPGGAEEHGDMGVVAARVHLPGAPALVLPLHGLLMSKHTEKRRKRHQPGCRAKPGTAAARSPPSFSSSYDYEREKYRGTTQAIAGLLRRAKAGRRARAALSRHAHGGKSRESEKKTSGGQVRVAVGNAENLPRSGHTGGSGSRAGEPAGPSRVYQ